MNMTLALETEHLTPHGPSLEPWRRPIIRELDLQVSMFCQEALYVGGSESYVKEG
jgi:hypothetical protein